jgi:type II secretory pathway component GspD/PulD (secretin)
MVRPTDTEGNLAMAFRANRWGWKATAARLLLAPVVAAGLAAPAVGQGVPATGKPAPTTAKPAVTVSGLPVVAKSGVPTTVKPSPVSAKPADPKELLKMGREALKAGKLDEAQKLARQADSANPAGRWGLFDDTPESLEKDVRSAKVKSDKAAVAALTAQAKTTYSQSAAAKTDADKLALLNQAYDLADRAATLSGPAGFFDDVMSFGRDDPAKMKKDIDAVRIPLRKKVSPTEMAKKSAAPAKSPAPTPGIVLASGTTKPTAAQPTSAGRTMTSPSVEPAKLEAATNPKADAAKMVADGRKLMKQGMMVEAKAKAVAAVRMKASFGPAEDTPDALMRDVLAESKRHIDVLTAEAKAQAAKKDYKKADAALSTAHEMAAGMGFPTKGIDEQHASVRKSLGLPPVPAETAVAVVTPPAVPTVTPPAAPTVTPVAAAELVVPVVPAMPAAPTAVAVKPVEPVMLPDAPAPAKDLTASAASLPPIGLPAPPKVVPAAGQVPGLPAVPSAPVTPVMPSAEPNPTAVVQAPAMPVVPVTPDGGMDGKRLLAQADEERRHGDLETAAKLATKAHNSDPGVKPDAQAMLRMIDADKADRRKADAVASFRNAVESANAKQYDQALAVLRLLDPDSLSPDQRAELPTLVAKYADEAAKQKAPAAEAKPTDTLAEQVKSLKEVEVQKLRAEGIDVETKAKAAFDRGETDLAIQMMTDFIAKVKRSNVSPGVQNQIAGQAGRRIDNFTLLKRQMDVVTKEASDKRYAKEQIKDRSVAEIAKKEEIARKVREVDTLIKAHKHKEAEGLALQLKTLDPDDPAVATLYELAKRHRRVEEMQRLKDDKEELFYNGLRLAETEGPALDVSNPVQVNIERMQNAARRGGDMTDLYAKSRTVAERQIELKLDRQYSFDFANRPLREVLGEIRSKADVNLTTDDSALGDEQISLDQVTITESVKDMSLRSILAILLDKARLKYVIENDSIRVTTDKKAKGRLMTRVFSVMELVTPVPDFALADHQNINKVLQKASNPMMPWQTAAQQGPAPAANSLNGGELVSGGPGSPGSAFSPNGNALWAMNNGNQVGSGGAPIQSRQQTAAQLQKMITKLVRPYSWDDMGGAGRLEYYDIGGALVVNQTADVIGEVQDLLNALRRLQDLSMTVEVRLISLTESFYERVGVDFAVNIQGRKTGRDGSQFERSLTTGQFRPEPFTNSINGQNNTIVGWNPTAGGFTRDLNIPISNDNSYGLSLPPFGGYNGPSNSGGLNVGLAFLNDIQVYMFLEAAQGDRRVNVMQAPKLTLFNGQTSTVSVNDSSFFTTGLQVFNVGGQFVYLPQNTPAPTSGVNLTIQGVVTADRKFVRLTLAPILNELSSATIPLFPVTAFITPVFEGGSQGVPIPFTQFFQQPSFATVSVQTTVQVPDGGTVVLGGLKRLAEGRNEFGPPVVSSIPYLNRLFRNQGIGRETTHLMIMVTPRIVINAEEELVQTGQSPTFAPVGPNASASQ